MKGIYKMSGSKFWWFRWSEGGKRYAVSLKTDDESLAITKARAILAEGLQLTVPSRLSVDALITQYLRMAQERAKKPMRPETAKRHGYVLKKFVSDINCQVVSEITHKKIFDWLNRGDGITSRDTVHTYARTLRTFCAYLVRTKVARGDLLDNFDIPARAATGRKNWLKKDEAQRVIAESKDVTLTFILYCGFHLGLRRNEICNAKVGWFDLDAGLAHIQNDPKSGFVLKDRENRSVPLTSEFEEFLQGFLKGKVTGSYALHPEKELGKWMYRYDFRGAFKNHMKRCGVVCTMHDMRRSFASNLVSAGESIYIVASWLGDGVQVVERSYGHLAPSAGNINRLTAKVA